MEQINNENKLQKNKIEIGEIFFSDIRNLAGADIDELEAEVKEGTIDIISWCHGYNVNQVIQKYYKTSILIALKYLGNGIFEEMVTGEKIITSGENLRFKETESSTVKKELSDINYDSSVILNYEDYLIENQEDAVLSKNEYIQLLKNCIKRMSESPISLANNVCSYEINDISKKMYLEHSDEERKLIIAEVKKMALLDAKEVKVRITNEINARIDNEAEKIKIISSEEIDMAYLDNELFDFERKGRTR